MQFKKQPTNFNQNQTKIYVAAMNLQALVGTVESRSFDLKIKNLLRKRQHELVAYTNIDKNDSYKSIQDILNNFPIETRPEKIDAAFIYIDGDQIKNYTAKVEDKNETNTASNIFTNEFFAILKVTQTDSSDLYQFMMKAFHLFFPIKNKTKAGIQVLYQNVSLLEEAGLLVVFSHLKITGSKLGVFPNLGISDKTKKDDKNDDDDHDQKLDKYGTVIVNNIMKVIGNNRIYQNNCQQNSTQFS